MDGIHVTIYSSTMDPMGDGFTNEWWKQILQSNGFDLGTTKWLILFTPNHPKVCVRGIFFFNRLFDFGNVRFVFDIFGRGDVLQVKKNQPLQKKKMRPQDYPTHYQNKGPYVLRHPHNIVIKQPWRSADWKTPLPIGSMVLLCMVTWIPSIYPLYVSINIPAPWIRHGLWSIWCW